MRSPLPHSPGGVTERKNPLRWRISLGSQGKVPTLPLPPPLERRGGQGVRERENPLRWRISLVTQWKMLKMPPPPGRRGTRRDAAAGEEETRDSGARKYIAVEDLAPLLSGLP